jgi:hypothetical protein
MIFKITKPLIFRSRKYLKIIYTSKYSDCNPGTDVAIKNPPPPPPVSFSLMRVIAACTAEGKDCTLYDCCSEQSKDRDINPLDTALNALSSPSLTNPLHFPDAEFLDKIQTKVVLLTSACSTCQREKV